MSWQNAYTFGGPNWSGIPQANTGLIISSLGYTSTVSNALSTTTGIVSNALQGEISTIVAGGTTSLWANYPAIANVDMAGFSLNNARYVSTLDLQVSSINGTDIKIFNSTVTIAGVTINNGTVTTTNITNNPAKGGGSGGGDNPTTGGSGNSTWQMVNSAVGATMDTVSKVQGAVAGVLNNTGAVLFQTYYAVETAGAVVDLANGAVRLATNAQALYDTREQNLIAGPGGPPGQTSYVYETINGTTQLQFSTLGTSVTSVFRTTDQANPNQTFGREIFTSTIIPAGSKVIRSMSDPYQFNILSTVLLSTTNYLQSFGQWHAILEPDYFLNVSSLTADNISTLYLSTGKINVSSILTNNISTATANISSINGVSLYDLLNKTPSNISTTTLSTSFLQVSSAQIQTAYISSLFASTVTVCNIIDNVVSTTTGYFDTIYASSIQAVLTPYFQSTTTQTFDSISSIYQPIINAQLTGSDSGPQQFGLQDYQIFDAANIGFWNGKAFKNFNVGTSIINFISGGIQDGAYIDISTVAGGTVNVIDRGGLVTSLITAGTTLRITWKASLVVFAVTTAPAPTITTLGNSFTLGQSFNAVLLSTPYQLVVNAGETVFNQQVTANDSLIGNKLSYLSTLQTNNVIFTSPLANPNGSYDLNRTFASTVTTGSYDNVSSLATNILNYNLSATIPNEATFYFGASFIAAGNDSQWANEFLVATVAAGSSISLINANSTNYFDVQNQSAGTLQITDYTATPGASLAIFPGNTTIYRFTATVTAGKTTWAYTTSPGIYNPQTVTNNLAISADLQNTYISSINRVKFNTGEVYFNAPIYAPFAYIDNIVLNKLTLSTVTATSATISSASISSLTLKYGSISTANISTFTVGNAIFTNITTNQATISNATVSSATISNASICNANIYRINGGTFYSTEVGTNVVSDYITLSTAFTTIGLTQYRDSYNQQTDNLVPARLMKSEMSYSNWPGWNGTYNNIYLAYVNSNGDVFLNGTPNTTPRNFNILSAVVTLGMVDSGSPYYNNPALYFETPSQNFKAAAISNDIYAFFTFTAGTNPFALTVGGPGAYLPNTYNSATGYAYQLTLTSGGAVANKWQYTTQTRAPYTLLSTTSIVSIDHSPADRLKFTANTLTMSALSNVDFLTSNVTFNDRQAVRWDQGANVNIDAHGGNWAYGETNMLLTNPYNGLTYSADWEPTCTLTTIRPNQQNLAINAFVSYVFLSGSVWYCKVFIQTPTVTGTGNAHDVPVTVNVTMTPKPLLKYANPVLPRDDPDFSTLYGYSSVFSRLAFPEMEFSSITASTITVQALENISFNADVAVPTFIGTGSISLNAKNSVNLMTNYDIVAGADREIDMTGASTIRFTSPEIRAHGFTTVKIPGTSSIPAVSALALTNGNQYDGAQNKSQIEFQFYGGGFNHYISSRHDANVVYGSGNAIDFWLYSVYTSGDAQTASSAPGTGNVNTMSLTASNVVINRPIQISDSSTGGTGTLTVDSSNHLYWNGTLIV